MHLSALEMYRFKRFEHLRIELAGTPKLVVLCGENGTGKSSVLDALSAWRLRRSFGVGDEGFFVRSGTADLQSALNQLSIQFHEGNPPDPKTAVYVRTAQRLTVEFTTTGVAPLQPSPDLPGPPRSIDVDDRVGENFQRLVSASVQALWDPNERERKAGDIIDELTGRVNAPLSRLLPGLTFLGPGSPLEQQATFRFTKDGVDAYAYKNLSGGEKAVFDLLLDATLKSFVFDTALWCLDEPELHVNPRIHGGLLAEILDLLDPRAQLWIASHSAGMLAEARQRYERDPNSVAFLDLADRNPAEDLLIQPSDPDRAFWRRQLGVALGDLASLVAPQTIVICEGSPDRADRPKARWDSRVLDTIFGARMVSVAFISVGNADDVIGDRMDISHTVEALTDGSQTLRLIDRDGRSGAEIEDLREAGCRVLMRRHLEAYLLDPEVLDALCERFGHADRQPAIHAALEDALTASQHRGNPTDDVKSAAGDFVVEAKKILDITTGGNNTAAFLRDTIAPCMHPGMAVYRELYTEVFGDEPPASSKADEPPDASDSNRGLTDAGE